MSVAPAPANTLADPRFERAPKVRAAMLLIVPTGRITVTELTSGGRLTMRQNDSGLERELDLNVRELRALAAEAYRIARRVSTRPEWKP